MADVTAAYSQKYFLLKAQVIIRPLPWSQQDSLLLAGLRIYPQIYHRAPCPIVRICKVV